MENKKKTSQRHLEAITGGIPSDLSDKLQRTAVVNKSSAVGCVELARLTLGDNGVKWHRAL